jgi:hypothetical protein
MSRCRGGADTGVEPLQTKCSAEGGLLVGLTCKKFL